MAPTSLPAQFGATVDALHRVAEQIVAPARKPDNEIALQATPGGFGTPPFEYGGASHQVRVDGTDLVDGDRRAPLTSLEAARGIVSDLVPAQLDDAPLQIDPAAAAALADAYEFGASVLQQLIDDAEPGDEPSPVTIWPEHFDIAIELGAGDARANYGLSPGDPDHDEPYLYVGPWNTEVEGDLWNGSGFAGAELTWSDLAAADDRRAAALEFFKTRMQALRRM
jgi:hypothetical protein